MSGEYAVLTEYKSGRIGLSIKRFKTYAWAEKLARARRERRDVKRAEVKYLTSGDEEIKNLL